MDNTKKWNIMQKYKKKSQIQIYDLFDNHLWHMFMSSPIYWNLVKCSTYPVSLTLLVPILQKKSNLDAQKQERKQETAGAFWHGVS